MDFCDSGKFPVQDMVVHNRIHMQTAFAGHPLNGHRNRLRNFYSFFINMAVRHPVMFVDCRTFLSAARACPSETVLLQWNITF